MLCLTNLEFRVLAYMFYKITWPENVEYHFEEDCFASVLRIWSSDGVRLREYLTLYFTFNIETELVSILLEF